jgi:hypothetical protein
MITLIRWVSRRSKDSSGGSKCGDREWIEEEEEEEEITVSVVDEFGDQRG